MDSPPDLEPLTPFLKVARHLHSLGISTPEIRETDERRGFAIIEDFGDQTFTRLLAGGFSEIELYDLATDVLVALHQHPAACDIAVPYHDTDMLVDRAMLFADWYLPLVLQKPLETSLRGELKNCWRRALSAVGERRETLVLRDYHVDNNMYLESRSGIKRCGLLDFQDAAIGSRCYDLMSLLEDARRDIGDELRSRMIERYCERCSDIDRSAFDRDYACLAAQRHARVAGVFCRLTLRDGKRAYFAHLPRVLSMLSRALEHPALTELDELLEHRTVDWRQGLTLERANRNRHLVVSDSGNY